jgi:hypothetical protein
LILIKAKQVKGIIPYNIGISIFFALNSVEISYTINCGIKCRNG